MLKNTKYIPLILHIKKANLLLQSKKLAARMA
jgi:hypothetical protein